MVKRRAHTRVDPRTGKQVKVAAHEVNTATGTGPGAADPVSLERTRIAAEAARAFDRDAMYMLDDDTEPFDHEALDDALDDMNDVPLHELSGGYQEWDLPEDGAGSDGGEGEAVLEGFDDVPPEDFDLFDSDGRGGGGWSGSGHARNGIEYALRQSMMRQGTGGQRQSQAGLKFNPDASMFGRLFRAFGGGGGRGN